MKFSKILKSEDFENKLINNEIDLTYKNSLFKTLFIYAASNEKYVKQLELILRYYKKQVMDQVHRNKKNALYVAIDNGNTKGVKVLLDYGFDPNVDAIFGSHDRPIILASQKRNLSIVKLLIEHGADVNVINSKQFSPLRNAIFYKNLEMVRYLINKGADVNTKTIFGKALRMALILKEENIAKLLIEHGAFILNISNEGKSALHIAASNGQLDMLKYLVDLEPNIHLQCHKKETILMCGCRNGEYEIVQYLLSLGAKVNCENAWGETSLLLALKSGNLKIVKSLLEHGASLEKEKSRIYPILFQDIRNHEVVDFLLEKGFNMNLKDRNGKYGALRFVNTPEKLDVLEKHKDKMEPELLDNYLARRLELLISLAIS
ncbi:ankyrin repeat domain-containing protein [Bacillus cereus]|uniref:ankyrin repeat domain-containing protein n=1 Tax=Bacillus cereus TaxID=1396 RepID=UPI00307A660F